MQTIDLQAIPNQRLQFLGDGQQYDITLRTIDDCTYMDVTMNGVVLITAVKCMPGQIVMPYPYLEGAGGNFIFNTASGNDPFYTNFGAGDTLLYATHDELAAARNG